MPQRHVDERSAVGREFRGPAVGARTGRACGRSGWPDREIDERSAAALELHWHTPDASEEARTRLAFGSRLRRARRRIDARLSLRESLSTFEDRGRRRGPTSRWSSSRRRVRPCTTWNQHDRRADAAGVADRDAPRRRPDDPRGRSGTLPQSEDSRVPPAPRVHEARETVAGGTRRRAASSRPVTLTRSGPPASPDHGLPRCDPA